MSDITFVKKLNIILEHIQNVQRLCVKLGLRLIDNGEVDLGRILIANGLVHDNSKLKGIEFNHLFAGDEFLTISIKHHQTTNPHHPEYWGGIYNMPKVYLAEMVCDCTAREMNLERT